MSGSRIASGMIVATMMVAPALAQEAVWSPTMTEAIGSTGDTITQSETQEQRLNALEGAVTALDAYYGEPGAPLMVSMLESQYAGEYALHWTDNTLDAIGSSESLSAEQAQVYIAGLATNIAVLSDSGTVLPSEAIRLADAIDHYNTAIGPALGLPFDDVLAQIIDDPALVELVKAAMDDIRLQADSAREQADLEAADAAAIAEHMRTVLDHIPSQAGPAFGGPAAVVFGETLEWNGEMYAAATDGIDIVADGIETGQVDTTRLRAVEDRINELRRGPWGSDTARGFARQWCDRMTAGARQCESVVDALLHVFEDDDDDQAPVNACAQFDFDVGLITGYFVSDTEGWGIFGDAHGLVMDGGGLQITDDAVGDVWYWNAPPKFLGCRERYYGGTLAFNLRIDRADELFNAVDVEIVGASSSIQLDLAQNPGTEWTPYEVRLSADGGWISAGSGAPASAQEIRAVLWNIQALRIRGEYRTGPDIGWLSDVEMRTAP